MRELERQTEHVLGFWILAAREQRDHSHAYKGQFWHCDGWLGKRTVISGELVRNYSGSPICKQGWPKEEPEGQKDAIVGWLCAEAEI